MLAKVILKLLPGTLMIGIGGFVSNNDVTLSWVGNALAIFGIIYVAVVAMLHLYAFIMPGIHAAAKRRSEVQAHEELLRLNVLLEKEIITTNEFMEKSRVLKKKIL